MFDNNIGQGPRTTGGRHLSKLPGSVQIEMAAIAIIAAAGAVKVTGTVTVVGKGNGNESGY